MGADDEREKSKKRKRKRRSAGGGGRKESSSTKERAADDALGNGDGDDAEGRKDDEESRARRRKEVRPKTEEGEGIVDEDGEGRKEASGPSPDVVGSECEKEVSDPSPDTIRSECNKEGEEEHDPSQAPVKKKRKRKRKKKKAVPEGSEAGASPGVGVTSGKEAKLTAMEHTVYVEGIPFDCSEDDVKHFFEENGCSDVLQMRLPRWQDSGRLRGYGHVVFDTVASRNMAILELDGLNLGRRYLTIREPNAPRPGTSAAASSGGVAPRTQPEGCRTVFVKNLPYESSEDDVALAFRPCGKIVDGGVRIARNYNTKQCKGFAYVEFKNPEGAFSAVQKAAKPFGMAVKGRPCFVDYDEGKMKGSYRTAEGKLWQKEHGSIHSTGGK